MTSFIIYRGPNKIIDPGAIEIIDTGIFIAIPHGYEGQIRPRSSMGSKGIIIPNSPGTIDSDYRGQIKIILLNLSRTKYEIKNSNKIAQIIFSKVIDVEFSKDRSGIQESSRKGGLGSTGI